MNQSYKYIFLSILAASAISCSKSEIDEQLSNEITLEVRNVNATRAFRYNNETDFRGQTFGLYAWNDSYVQIYNNESVSKTGDVWKPAASKQWTQNAAYTFEAVYPKPAATLGSVGLTALSVNKNPSSLTFSYKVPATTMATEDKDFMLAYYSGTGTAGKADLTFTHPLTCVNFKEFSMSGTAKINSIKLSGVYESGSCTVRTTTEGCYSYEVSDSNNSSLWTPSGSTTVKGAAEIAPSALLTTSWAYNFLLIPQNTATQKVKIIINITDDDGNTYNIAKDIEGDYWRAGYTNTYKIKYNAVNGLVLELVTVTPWDETTKYTPTFKKIEFLPGAFSVSPTKKVYFSKGNLQAIYDASTSSYTWRFASCQYDYVGNASGNTTINSQTDEAVVDLFGWSTSTTNYGINTSTSGSDYSGGFVDWATTIDDTGTWFTLSTSEWAYLRGSTPDRAGKYRSGVMICGQLCVVYAPDNYTGTIASSYDSTTWSAAEAAGLICLPAAGRRLGTSVGDENTVGAYWSSSGGDSVGAYGEKFDATGVTLYADNRRCGLSVRLVQECKE